MRRVRKTTKASPVRRDLGFLLAVLVVAGLAGLLSFHVGRDWLGKNLADVNLRPGAPQIVVHGLPSEARGTRGDPSVSAPAEAVVNIEEREPTPAEVRRVQEEEASGGMEPRQTKSLSEADSAPSDESMDSESDRAGDRHRDTTAQERRTGRFTVTAGSFAEKENADRVRDRLIAAGYKPRVREVDIGSEVLHRVDVATLEGRTQAEELKDELARDGIRAGIIPAR